MRYIELFNPTNLIKSALEYKGAAYKINSCKCPAFQDAEDPIIFDGGRWIMGVYPIIGWLDRRILWPQFFPDDYDAYAKACMVFDTFLVESPDPEDWMDVIKDVAFVLGKDPCIVDLVLSGQASINPAWVKYQARVREAHGKIQEGVAA